MTSNINNTLIPVLKDKLPQFVKENYPRYEQFVVDYLKWLQQDDNFLGVLQNWSYNTDPTNDVDPYINQILNDLGFSAGQSLAIDKPLLIHLLQQFYSSRGSIASFRFLFKILFNSDVQIRYPRQSLLIPSSASYGQRHFIFSSSQNFSRMDFSALFDRIKFYGGTLSGVTSKVKAAIENIQIVHGSGKAYFKIQILKPYSEFLVGQAVTIQAGDFLFSEVIMPVLDLKIDTAGKNYSKGDIIQVSGASINGSSYVSSTVKAGVDSIIITNGGTDYSVGDLILASASDGGFGFSATVASVLAGVVESVTVNSKGYSYSTLPTITTQNGTAVFTPVSSKIGAVQTISYDSPFVDFDTLTIQVISDSGTGATLSASSVSRWTTKGWTDRKGFLDENSTLIDSDRYQQFSYQIISQVPDSQYRAYVKDYLHPAGFLWFSTYGVTSEMTINMQSDFTITTVSI